MKAKKYSKNKKGTYAPMKGDVDSKSAGERAVKKASALTPLQRHEAEMKRKKQNAKSK